MGKFEKAKDFGETHLMDSKVVDSEAANANEFDFDNVLDECESRFRFCIVDGAVKIIMSITRREKRNKISLM